MVQYRLNIETESRIRWKVYVRFGGEHLEIAHVHMIRRRVLSLHIHSLLHLLLVYLVSLQIVDGKNLLQIQII